MIHQPDFSFVKKSHTLVFLFFQLIGFRVFAQIENPVSWEFSVVEGTVEGGATHRIFFKAIIQDGWYIYGLGPYELAPATQIKLEQSNDFNTIGTIITKGEKKKNDEYIGAYGYFVKQAQFEQKISARNIPTYAKGILEYSACSLESGMCLPPKEVEFVIPIKASGASKAVATTPEGTSVADKPLIKKTDSNLLKGTTLAKKQTADSVQTMPNILTTVGVENKLSLDELPMQNASDAGLVSTMSLWAVFVLSFLSGLVALITPCVFPMIPMTVTFFLKSGKTRVESVLKALVYGLSIILIYTLIGTLVAKLAGPEAANFLSTHWLPNMVFFAVFLIFALAFLGAFEITLPSAWVNAADRGADRGGWLGVFFMAFTLVLVSFSCTGPIVGTILVQSAGGATLLPMVGMFGFSLAFALPFTLFALFPTWLRALPKSGGWLNDVKVSLGFLELGLALKFFSLADQAYHWNLLSREVNLVIWIAIGIAWTLYLWNKIKLYPSDETTNVPKLLLGMVVLSFTIYLIPGLWGAPLKPLSGYLPPLKPQEFHYQNPTVKHYGNAFFYEAAEEVCSVPTYADRLHLPHQLQGYFMLDEALACAKMQGKPVFVDFTGHGCVNCREMEANIWSDPAVLSMLRKDFVKVALYVDDKTELPESKWYKSPYDGKLKTSIGKQNADLQVRLYKTNAQPFYLILDPNGSVLSGPQAYTSSVEEFLAFLEKGKSAFQQGNTP